MKTYDESMTMLRLLGEAIYKNETRIIELEKMRVVDWEDSHEHEEHDLLVKVVDEIKAITAGIAWVLDPLNGDPRIERVEQLAGMRSLLHK